MSTPQPSKRFNPSTLTEKIVPVLFIILILIFVAVFVIIGLSLVGIIPSA